MYILTIGVISDLPNCKPQKAITNGVLSDLPHAPEKAE